MHEGLFAGLDVSTQSCKIVVIDVSAGSVAYVDSVNYDEDLPEYQTKNGVIQGLAEGVSESNPKMFIDAVNRIFFRLAASHVPLDKIRCISVSGQQHGLVALDVDGRPARDTSKLWNDFSTLEECELLNQAVGGPANMIDEVCNSQRTGYTAAKIFHMVRHEPMIYHRSTILFLVHNFINWYLTGGESGGVSVMEPGDTSGMALWNPVDRDWSKKVANAIDPGLLDKLPEVRPSDESIGYISDVLADKYGFSKDCKIDAGSGDNMYGAIGTGNIRPGIVTVSLGTSGTAYTFMENPYVDPEGEIALFCDSTGHYLPLLCVSNLANGYDSILTQYGLTHNEFSAIVSKTNAGNGGRVLIPWYEGERTPDVPSASPVYFGFGLSDFTKEILCRAVLEGHVQNLYDGFRKMPATCKEIRLTGGLSQSRSWRQAIADIFEADVVPVKGEGAALGAAIHAAWVCLKESATPCSLEELVDSIITLDNKKRRKPIKENVKAYRIQKELFSALSLRLRGKQGKDPFSF
ncbi:MAG: hypothetical protein GY847_41375 [Proteobacteria bacterium]|nr:hypothetical protein [Pseudomonadota bacterium]